MLGTDFSKESLELFFASGKQITSAPVIPKRKPNVEHIINIEAKMAEGKGKGYENWAKLFNLKQSAKALSFIQEHGIQTIAQLNDEILKLYDSMRDAAKEIKGVEKQIKYTEDLAYWCAMYREHQPHCRGIKECRTKAEKDKYREVNRSHFALRDAAKEFFEEHKVSKPLPSAKDLEEWKQAYVSEKNRLYNTYQEQKALLDDLHNSKDNLIAILEPDRAKAQTKHRSQDMSL